MIPTNEMGVIIEFVRQESFSGFKIISIQTAFPDAIIEKDGQRYRAEFEYRASSFLLHGHDWGGCDLIICWDKDIDCVLPVLALSDPGWAETGLPTKAETETETPAPIAKLPKHRTLKRFVHETKFAVLSKLKKCAIAVLPLPPYKIIRDSPMYREAYRRRRQRAHRKGEADEMTNDRVIITCAVYRSGNGDDLQVLVLEALAHFQEAHGRQPVSITVHKSLLEKVQMLDLGGLVVKGSGGCLAGECWLEHPRNTVKLTAA